MLLLGEAYALHYKIVKLTLLEAVLCCCCRYKVGKTLGQGTYAVVKEAVHIKTGQYYACKVISKRLMEGREHMVRNEIAALKKVSQVSR